MSEGFKGFAQPGEDKEFTLNINGKEVQKIIRAVSYTHLRAHET